jgi:glycosyltransferase involved in cell wall biosynthesis
MKISVVLPVFNAGATIAQAVTSLHSQTQVPFEIIVVDDGSTDGTGLLDLGADPLVRVIRRSNGGPAAARNTGVRESRGDAIAFLDADDLLTPSSLAIRMACLIDHPYVEAVFGLVDCGNHRVLPAYLPGGLLIQRKAFFDIGLFDENLRVGEFIDWLDRARAAGLREFCVSDVVLRRDVTVGGVHVTQREAKGFIGLAGKLLERRRRDQFTT